MTRVFRIETHNGDGICAAGTGICKKYHDASDHHRGCGMDTCFGDKRQGEAAFNVLFAGWRFAFQSLEAARRWFPIQSGREAMEKAGAVVVEYETTHFMFDRGRHQLIFDHDNAKRVAEHSVVTLE